MASSGSTRLRYSVDYDLPTPLEQPVDSVEWLSTLNFFVATWGIFLHTISYLMWNFGVLKNAVAWITIAVIGWVPMVTGQSLVLYSRLHLIVYDERILRLVLAMIISDVFIGHVPTIIVA
ncbi:hypothetical protein B0T10DRAFT_568917 [Thelonectria olida]|uniref:DUF7703 domain-containing protein n=1 Tax=Thelonectria olida TaxID=1576542 RepID=A0A9P9AJP0_9HYPO|nr:hypothetical protein B0T10DRAFT_568917 [Thelonectria olida]